MRPIRQTLNAPGYSAWISIDYEQSPVNLALAVIPWSTATGLSYTVQHTFDSTLPTLFHYVSIARAAAVATVTDLGPDNLGHGLSTGDNVVIKGSGSTYLDTPKASIGQGDIGAQVTVTSNTTYTYAVTNAGPTTDGGTAKVQAFRVFNCDISTLVGASTRLDGNYAYPVRAIRLYVATLTAGAIDFVVNQGGR